MESGPPGKRVVFLDRDGVICENRPDFVKTWDEFIFIPGAAEAVRRLNGAGLLVVVVTNQSGVSRGVFTAQDVDRLHARMVEALAEQGARVDAVYFCPHTDHDGCSCRKPKPGMLLRAAGELGIDLKRSFLIGDAVRDLQAAASAGATGILVRTGLGAEQQHLLHSALPGAQVTEDLLHAVDMVLSSLDDEGN